MTSLIAEKLTAFLAGRGTITQDETELYRFGFQAGLEFMSCLFVSVIVALLLHRLPEYLLFLIVFIPIRSFAGGFHFKKFGWCFLGSCVLIVVVTVAAERMEIPQSAVLAGILAILLILGISPQAEHPNRSVTEAERQAFQNILRKILMGVGILSVGMYFWNRNVYLNVILLTLVSVWISMLIGIWSQQCKNKTKGKNEYEG